MDIYDLPEDVIVEIFTYLVNICKYQQTKTRIKLKRSLPEIYYHFNKSISEFNRESSTYLSLNNQPHQHYVDSHMKLNLCSYTYPFYIIDIYSKLNLEIKRIEGSSSGRSRRGILGMYENSMYYSINIHFKESLSARQLKKVPYIVNDFLKQRGVLQYVFSHVCCGGAGIFCRHVSESRNPI